jgi:pyrroloquinoline quinone (PQQ) biosynthesis protein C
MHPFAQLESATQAARRHVFAAPILEDVALGRFDRATYLRFLQNAYHHVKHTVPLMMACGARLPDRLAWMRAPLTHYIEEEQGHEQWILDDINASGGDAAAVARSRPGFEVEMLVGFVYDYVARHNPVGFFGMVYVLEGTSSRLASEVARHVQAKLHLPDDAFRYLRSHGELDQSHVGFFRTLIDELTDLADVDAVIHVATRVFRLYGDVIRSAREEATCDAP